MRTFERASESLTTLVVGVPAVHWGDPFGVVEAGVAYMAVLVAFTIAGAGRISLDAARFARGHRISRAAESQRR